MPRPDLGTRQKLIDTAIDLLWRSSYAAVSVDDMCKAADVKKGSFYHYFPSKQDLAIAAIEDYFAQNILPDLDRIFAPNRPFAEQIDLLADAIMDEQKQAHEAYGMVCGCPMATLATEMAAHQDEPIVRAICSLFDQCKTYIRKAMAHAVETKIIPPCDIAVKTDEVHDFITGQMMMARIHNTLDGLERNLKPGLRYIVGLEIQNINVEER